MLLKQNLHLMQFQVMIEMLLKKKTGALTNLKKNSSRAFNKQICKYKSRSAAECFAT